MRTQVPHHFGLAALVGSAAWFHLHGQQTVPPAYNETWGMQAACLPLTLRESVGLSTGMTLDWLAAWLRGRCDFAATTVRWLHPWVSVLAVAVAAFAWPGRRSASERWLTALFLLGNPYALHYGHHGRQYSMLLFAGTTLWATRSVPGWSWLRATTGAAAALSAPFAVPWWAALKWQQRHHAPRTGWWAEVVLMTAVTAWQVALYWGPVRAYVDLFRYTLWDRHGRLTLGSILDLVGWRLGPLQTLGWLLAAALAVWGWHRSKGIMRRVPWLGLALIAVAWPLAAPPLYARYALTLATAWPVWIATGLAALPHPYRAWRLFLTAVVVAGWLSTTAVYVRGAPDVFWGVEARMDLDTLQAHIAEGDTVVVWGGMLLEPVVLHILATRRVHVVIWRDEEALKYDAQRRALGTVVPWDRLPAITALPWVRAASVVTTTTLTSELFAPTWARGGRVIGVGVASITYGMCDAPCPELVDWQRTAVRVVESPQHLQRSDREALFAVANDAAALPLVETLAGGTAAWIRGARAYHRTPPAVTDRVE